MDVNGLKLNTSKGFCGSLIFAQACWNSDNPRQTDFNLTAPELGTEFHKCWTLDPDKPNNCPQNNSSENGPNIPFVDFSGGSPNLTFGFGFFGAFELTNTSVNKNGEATHRICLRIGPNFSPDIYDLTTNIF